MIEPRVIELMNLAVDGVATPRQRADLEAALAAQPEARTYYDSLARVVERLDADPMQDPPAELEPRILDAIERSAIARPVRLAPTRRRFFSFGPLRPWSTFGLGLAAGMVIIAALQLSRPGIWQAGRDVTPSNVSGSMVPEEKGALASVPVETKDGTVTGSATVSRDGDSMVVRLQLQSTVPVEWKLAFDGDAWSLLRVERQGTATVAFAANRASIQGLHTGEGGFTLVFSGAPEAAQAVVLTLVKDGQTVFEGRPSVVK
jgi:hypothetical protein